MAINDEKRLQEENRRLRRKLAELGVRPPERGQRETLQEEYARLREILRWYVELLLSV